jgi:DNA transposition AAA+ family ATPase
MTQSEDELAGFQDVGAQFRIDTLLEAFSPSAPIDRRDVFAGRRDQLAALYTVMRQRGQHAVIYGERGVGKTSLASITVDQANRDEYFTAHVICDSSDNFTSIWRKIFEEIRVVADGEHGTAVQYLRDLADITPNEVRLALRGLTGGAPVLIFIDEFDQIKSREVKHLFADTIKILSDQAIRATIVLVGVGDSVTDLIDEHSSVARAIVQVEMPRLPLRERQEIIDKGLTAAGMTITVEAANRITSLSQGLPHYVHRLAQQAGLAAVGAEQFEVTIDDVDSAIQVVVTDAQESVSKDYHIATYSTRPENLYEDVLLACACAPADDRGYFRAAAVEGPLSAMTGKNYKVPAFARHLEAFRSEERRQVLVREGSPKYYRLRFRDPLLQPYVIMRGLRSNKVTDADLRQFRNL